MKLIQLFIVATAILLGSAIPSWAGADGLFVVYQIEKSAVDGRLNLRPVEIEFDTIADPGYAVFSEWLRPYLHDENKIEMKQINQAYCKGLLVDFRSGGHVHLDYAACTGKNKPTSEKDNLFEGIAAAILYTENVQGISPAASITLHIKGISKTQSEFHLSYSWDAIRKKWQPYLAGFKDRCK
jgi:hypothetical protein